MTQKASTQPPQQQTHQPGVEKEMWPRPISIHPHYAGSDKLKDKVVMITGGDSGIGRAIAYHAAAEGAKIIITYLEEQEDAKETFDELQKYNAESIAIPADLSIYDNCKKLMAAVTKKFKHIDCLINNAAIHYPQSDIKKITPEQLEQTFSTNVYSYFYLTQAALPYMTKGSTIINTASVVAYRGSEKLIDYSATKGAIVSFTRALAKSLIKKNIRVNAVAPGPVWTPLIPASYSKKKVSHFGENTLWGEPAQPADIAPAYIFLASDDSRFFVGQVLHPNGGEIINT